APLHFARLDVLVHSKEIVWIIFVFDLDESLVVVAIGGFHAFFAFVAHQKVYVRSPGRVRMQRVVITFGPGNDFFVVRRIGINAYHNLRPLSIAIIPGSIRFAYTRRGTVDWIHMHGGMHRWKRLPKGNVLGNRVIA